MTEILAFPTTHKMQDASNQTMIENENEATASNARAEATRDRDHSFTGR